MPERPLSYWTCILLESPLLYDIRNMYSSTNFPTSSHYFHTSISWNGFRYKFIFFQGGEGGITEGSLAALTIFLKKLSDFYSQFGIKRNRQSQPQSFVSNVKIVQLFVRYDVSHGTLFDAFGILRLSHKNDKRTWSIIQGKSLAATWISYLYRVFPKDVKEIEGWILEP